MKVTAYVLNDMTAFIGREDILKDYMERSPHYSAENVKDIIELDIPNHIIKRAFRMCGENAAKKFVLGIYANEILDPDTLEVIDRYYEDPMHVIFDSSTYDSFNSRLNALIRA